MKTVLLPFRETTWSVFRAENMQERTRGLLKHENLPEGELMLIPKCNSIHTFRMRFSIDVVFIDRHGLILRVVRNVRPWRMVWGGWRAKQVVEAEAGWLPLDLPENCFMSLRNQLFN